uniref:Poly [ADP-ribose] polymerase n=1 Tax=Cuerna arida TaxID=1464854 RepID=A0A1B6FPT7_9HEMI
MAAAEEKLLNYEDDSEEILEEIFGTKEQTVKRLFRSHLPDLDITRICKVKNSFLKGLYDLKKEEYKSRYGNVTERWLFHATSEWNVDSIIKDNLDWRRVSRSKFGMGVSFSDDADYANHFSNSNNGSSRAIIIANVLISKEHCGSPAMTIPLLNYDTTTGTRNGIKKVYVKYNDNEFLPEYVVFYKSPEKTTSKYYTVHRGFRRHRLW